jgi:type III pantothenate kinase
MKKYRLILDFGNTFQKVSIFSDRELVILKKFDGITLVELKKLLSNYSDVSSCILSSVIETPTDILNWLKKNFFFIELSHKTAIPIKNKYSSPNTLGKDRLAAAIGAYSLYKNQNVLSIDMGTAIKFDFITKKGEYLGGSISPGLYLRFKSLHTFTAKLPLVEYNNVHKLIGTDTETSILSGVMNGAIAEINTFIEEYKSRYSDLKIIISGGESIYFERYIKNHIFAVSNLVLLGLNEILIFNE